MTDRAGLKGISRRYRGAWQTEQDSEQTGLHELAAIFVDLIMLPFARLADQFSVGASSGSESCIWR